MDISDDNEIESIVYMCREVSVYKIPPRTKNEGYKAQEWGDLAAPLWKGRLRVIERSKGLTIQLEDATTGASFAQAPYGAASRSVEAVLDSSRYFVVRVEGDGRKAYIGLGFTERPDAFDFNVALQDYDNRTRRQARLDAPAEAPATGPSPHLPGGAAKDFTLKEGQTFTVHIPGKTPGLPSSKSSGASTSLLGGESASAGIPLLPPPPSAPRRR
ncbi:adaptin ear-binding coat-associated protein 1 NECAP-1 [Exidia glandulosa HHB12029]|uniref:Adaptin ear-binding coat-associated protein 1 NECAP-1 n=1 Tax=Exidia glandulosa HHB12029 TaxID=1314781 RepID=A0A165KE36_EXIGL|nr:adaptin ear-binding coat-associated protein 1 NECAP-1 [Exidia glandulosa HHB12029]